MSRWLSMKVVCFLIMSGLLLSGISGCRKEPVPPVEPPYEGHEIAFTTIVQGFALSTEPEKPRIFLAFNKKGVEPFIHLLSPEDKEIVTKVVEELDFDSYFVVGAFMGAKPTGGYEIEILRITLTKDKRLKINARDGYTKEPKPGEKVIGAFTSPYHIVKASKKDLFIDSKMPVTE